MEYTAEKYLRGDFNVLDVPFKEVGTFLEALVFQANCHDDVNKVALAYSQAFEKYPRLVGTLVKELKVQMSPMIYDTLSEKIVAGLYETISEKVKDFNFDDNTQDVEVIAATFENQEELKARNPVVNNVDSFFERQEEQTRSTKEYLDNSTLSILPEPELNGFYEPGKSTQEIKPMKRSLLSRRLFKDKVLRREPSISDSADLEF